MPLTMHELNGFGALGGENPAQSVPAKAKPAIDRYVACLKRNGLAKAFYLQDPRQEVVTEAHRAGDTCYEQLTPAIYISVKEVAKWHLNVSLSDAQVRGLFAAAKARQGFAVSGVTLNAEGVGNMVTEALSHVEFPAQAAASAQVGRVHAQEVTPSPLKIGAEEYGRRIRQQEERVQAGTERRVLRQEDVVSPEEQRAIERRVRAEAERAARERGMLVSIPRGASPEEIARRYAEARARREGKPFPWLVVGGGMLALAVILGILTANRGRREEPRELPVP